jgi:hypothetical protein
MGDESPSSGSLSRRFEGARRYLEVRANPRWGDLGWTAGYEMYLKGLLLSPDSPGRFSTPECLALCDPALWKHRVDVDTTHILGPKTFRSNSKRPALTCESELLFGYKCPVPHVRVEADHVFPRSLGGKTHPANRLYLCRFHNRSKGADIHFYPWDEEPQHWVKEVLDSVAHVIDDGNSSPR